MQFFRNRILIYILALLFLFPACDLNGNKNPNPAEEPNFSEIFMTVTESGMEYLKIKYFGPRRTVYWTVVYYPVNDPDSYVKHNMIQTNELKLTSLTAGTDYTVKITAYTRSKGILKQYEGSVSTLKKMTPKIQLEYSNQSTGYTNAGSIKITFAEKPSFIDHQIVYRAKAGDVVTKRNPEIPKDETITPDLQLFSTLDTDSTEEADSTENEPVIDEESLEFVKIINTSEIEDSFSFTDTEISDKTIYVYKNVAYDEHNNELFAGDIILISTSTALPSKIQKLKVDSKGIFAANLSWEKNPRAEKYNVFYYSDSGNIKAGAILSTEENTMQLLNIPQCSKIYVYVTGVNEGGDGITSDVLAFELNAIITAKTDMSEAVPKVISPVITRNTAEFVYDVNFDFLEDGTDIKFYHTTPEGFEDKVISDVFDKENIRFSLENLYPGTLYKKGDLGYFCFTAERKNYGNTTCSKAVSNIGGTDSDIVTDGLPAPENFHIVSDTEDGVTLSFNELTEANLFKMEKSKVFYKISLKYKKTDIEEDVSTLSDEEAYEIFVYSDNIPVENCSTEEVPVEKIVKIPSSYISEDLESMILESFIKNQCEKSRTYTSEIPFKTQESATE